MIVFALLLIVAVGNCQKGHYIRPLPDYRVPYRAPLFQEVYSPRMFRPVYFQPEQRVRGRSQDIDQMRKEEVKIDKPSLDAYPILSYSNEMAQDGAYSYKYETADGIMREESSVMEMSEDGKQTPKVRGSYSYPSPDGRIIKVEYVADEGGFRANQITEDSGLSSFRRLGSNGYSYSFRAP